MAATTAAEALPEAQRQGAVPTMAKEQGAPAFIAYVGGGVATALIAAMVGPYILRSWIGPPGETSIPARIALGIAGIIGYLALYAVFQLVRVPRPGCPVVMRVPPRVAPWLAGLAPIAVGILIGLTVFR